MIINKINKTNISKIIAQSQYVLWRLLSTPDDFWIREEHRKIYVKSSNNITFSAYPFDAVVDEINQAMKTEE